MMSRKRFALILISIVSLFLVDHSRAEDPPSLSRLVGRKVIVLDPGHGGHDPGAVGPSNVAEKIVALNLARRLKQTLDEDYTIVLTREGDYWLDIESRTAMANHHRADLFVSLHTGGSSHHQARGMAVFFYGRTPARGPQETAPLEQAGKRLRPWDHVQWTHTAKSRLLANLVHSHLLVSVNPIDRGIHEAACLVLTGADMPAILIEAGYVSHPEEEKELSDPKMITGIAEAIGEGIRAFFSQNSSENVERSRLLPIYP
jgi:N-acetylmuramoyl-L-alanine amidase